MTICFVLKVHITRLIIHMHHSGKKTMKNQKGANEKKRVSTCTKVLSSSSHQTLKLSSDILDAPSLHCRSSANKVTTMKSLFSLQVRSHLSTVAHIVDCRIVDVDRFCAAALWWLWSNFYMCKEAENFRLERHVDRLHPHVAVLYIDSVEGLC
jgi:hypothetical protein